MCLTIYKLLGKCLFVLPVITVVWTVVTFGITYGLAVGLNHTKTVFPFISEAGTVPPESGIFTFGIFITSLLLIMNAEMRFQFVKLSLQTMSLTPKERNRLERANNIGLYFGILAAVGLFFVASFQVHTMTGPHFCGAFMMFIFGCIGCWIQSVITWKLHKEGPATVLKITYIVQIINSLVVTIIFLLFCASFGSYSHQLNTGSTVEKIFEIFLTSAVSEWILALTVVFFVLTFIPGFHKMEFDGSTVKWITPVIREMSVCTRMRQCWD